MFLSNKLAIVIAFSIFDHIIGFPCAVSIKTPNKCIPAATPTKPSKSKEFTCKSMSVILTRIIIYLSKLIALH